MTLTELLKQIAPNGGFLTDETLPILAKLDPSRRVLARCGCGQFTAAADQMGHFINIIETEGSDYLRDVSLVAGDPAFQGDYRAVTPLPRSPWPSHMRGGLEGLDEAPTGQTRRFT
jgi:hypothetical protein